MHSECCTRGGDDDDDDNGDDGGYDDGILPGTVSVNVMVIIWRVSHPLFLYLSHNPISISISISISIVAVGPGVVLRRDVPL